MKKEEPSFYGQIVIGLPGSGKTTYCNGMRQLLAGLGRNVALINLDPANNEPPFEFDINISELITVVDVMEELKMGPNGALLYCMQFLEQRFDWLKEKLLNLKAKYLIFDCPGQVELYTNFPSMRAIVNSLTTVVNLSAVHLVDCIHCADSSSFISAIMVSLSAMLFLELPHVNVLSKVDLFSSLEPLSFGLEFYTDACDLQNLICDVTTQREEKPAYPARYRKLTSAIAEVVQDFGLVSFVALNIEDKYSVHKILEHVDKANGFLFHDIDSELVS